MKESGRKKLKLTEWMVGVNPLRSRPGFYQCKCCYGYMYWDGGKWWDHLWQISPVEEWRGVQR